MLNENEMNSRAKFYNDHGAHVYAAEGVVLFEDGASDNGCCLFQPPTDDYELSVIVAKYWKIVAQAAEKDFTAYKLYLGGSGKRKDEWARLYTAEEQLDHLRSLQQTAKKALARYRRMMREAKALLPEELREAGEAEIDDAARKHSFQSAVEEIQL